MIRGKSEDRPIGEEQKQSAENGQMGYKVFGPRLIHGSEIGGASDGASAN